MTDEEFLKKITSGSTVTTTFTAGQVVELPLRMAFSSLSDQEIRDLERGFETLPPAKGTVVSVSNNTITLDRPAKTAVQVPGRNRKERRVWMSQNRRNI